MSVDPKFWDDRRKSTELLQEKKLLEDSLKTVQSIQGRIDDTQVLLDFAEEGDDASGIEATQTIKQIQKEVMALETRRLLNKPVDPNSAIVTVNAGAGGTEACDWAQMILRMLLRFCEERKWKTDLVDSLDGDSAGIRNATFTVDGDFAYGLLKSESGVHRLVRISPYDSNARRHTSFCSVWVTPVIDDSIEVDVRDADLRIDTYRASGAGGQHVNRTESAVRITHVPSGVVVQCQTQRSQIQNRETCMTMLRAKLYDLEVQRRSSEVQAQEDAKLDNAFGSQIRSYVLHPYKLVKDTRTLQQHTNPNAVLDGDIIDFVYEYLRQAAAGSFKGKGLAADDDE